MRIKMKKIFTFLGNPPLKFPNPNCGRYTHPPTINITPLCSSHCTLPGGGGLIVIGWVWWEWLVTMDTKIICPTIFKAILRPLHPTSQDKTHTSILPRWCPTRPYEYHGQLSRFPNWEIVGILTNFHFPKRRAKPWKREVHLLQKKISETCRHVISFFKVRKGAHRGHPSPPHHHGDQGGGGG